MTQHKNIEVSSERGSLRVDGEEMFRSPFAREKICFVGRYNGRFLIATDYGCCPPGTIYSIGKDDTSENGYELQEVYATGLPVTALMLTNSGVLTVGHGCYSGVRFTKRDGTRFDIVDEETYRRLRHHEHTLPYGGGLEPRLQLDGDTVILQLALIERVPNKKLLESYYREKSLGKNPFPIPALEHPTDTHQSRGVVEHVDLTEILKKVGVTTLDVLHLEIIYSLREEWLRTVRQNSNGSIQT